MKRRLSYFCRLNGLIEVFSFFRALFVIKSIFLQDSRLILKSTWLALFFVLLSCKPDTLDIVFLCNFTVFRCLDMKLNMKFTVSVDLF